MNSNFVSKSRHYHGDGVPAQVTTTANHHYFEHLAGNTIVYDQTNEMLVVVRRTNGQYSTSNNEFEIVTVPYSDISNIRSSTSLEGIEALADKLIAEGLLSAGDKQAYLDQIQKIK